MSVSGIESTPGFPGLSATTATTGAGSESGAITSTSTSEDKDMFLSLLVAQMRYQDPSNPTDSAQFLAQTAQFTALEKMQEVADQTAMLVSVQMAFGASGMVGKTVSYVGADGLSTTGLVGSVRFETTGPVLQVDGTDVPLASVVTVAHDAAAAASAPFVPDPSSGVPADGSSEQPDGADTTLV